MQCNPANKPIIRPTTVTPVQHCPPPCNSYAMKPRPDAFTVRLRKFMLIEIHCQRSDFHYHKYLK